MEGAEAGMEEPREFSSAFQSSIQCPVSSVLFCPGEKRACRGAMIAAREYTCTDCRVSTADIPSNINSLKYRIDYQLEGVPQLFDHLLLPAFTPLPKMSSIMLARSHRITPSVFLLKYRIRC